MADCSNRFTFLHKEFYKFNGQRIYSQLIRIHYTTRKQQGIVFEGIGLFQGNIRIDFISPFSMLPALYFIMFRDYENMCPLLFQCFNWLCKLYLFKSVL